jgi:hypothetical protein
LNASEFVSAVKREVRSCRNEEEFRQVFLRVWQQLVRDLGYSDSIRLEEYIASGRADARFRSLVFEFKNPARNVLSSQSGRTQALAELRDHLNEYVSRGRRAEELKGILCDGEYIASLSYAPDHSRFVPVDQFERHVREESAFMPFERSALLIEGAIFGLTRRELTPENLLEEFGPGSSICRECVAAIWSALNDGLRTERVRAFYETWKLLFSLSTRRVVTGRDLEETLDNYGVTTSEISTEEDVRKFLFAIHTYYSTLLKFIAFAIADELKFFGTTELLQQIRRDPVGGLESGQQVLATIVVNIAEKDVFSWFENVWDRRLEGSIKTLADKISNYDLRGVRRDVLKRVYQHLIPPKLRKSLGEFYTKDWTADLVLDAVDYQGQGKILDPACGSGTFLMVAIERIRIREHEEPANVLLRTILDSVVGFDVNPIAVMTAKLNYLLATYDLIQAGNGRFEIPVYLCDSVLIPREAVDLAESLAGSGSRVYEITIPDPTIGTFKLPKHPDVLRLLQILERDVRRPIDLFLADVEDALGEQFVLDFKLTLRGLHEKMAKLDEKGLNEIWCRFLADFFHPMLIEPRDFVVGNPPWVAPVHVPQEYRNHVNEIVQNSGFLEPYEPHFVQRQPRFVGASEQFTACLAFMPRSLRAYLKPGGKLAFLLTSSLLRSLNAGGFREQLGNMDLDKILDLTLHTRIHEGATCWAFVPVLGNASSSHEGMVYSYYIPTQEPREPEIAPTFVTRSWQVEKTKIRLEPTATRSPWFAGPLEVIDLFRRMQKHPRIGDRYRLSMGIKTSANDLFFLQSIRRTEQGLVAATTQGGESINLEDELVYPLVRGRHVGAWSFDHSHVLVPHRPPEWKPVPENLARTRYREMYDHVSRKRNKRLLEARDDYRADVGPFYMIFRLSKRKVESWKVAYAEVGKQLEACVVPSMLDDGILGKKYVMLDHSAYFIASKTEGEASYLTAMLNSSPVRAFSYGFGRPKGGKPFRAFTSWTIAVLPVPEYSREDSRCASLVEKSKRAARSGQTAPRLQGDIDELAGELYGLSRSETRMLREHYLVLSGQIEETV